MNPVVERYLPPAIVLGAAVYFGWPPPEPLDLGDDVVRATSVRWRPKELVTSPLTDVACDPFKAVLVATKDMDVEPETGKLVVATAPVGPPVAELKAGLQLEGIASMGGKYWAVLNGRARLPGDVVRTADALRHECEIVRVLEDRIVVRCEQTEAEIHVRPSGSRNMPTARPVSLQAADPSPPTQDNTPPPPPQV